MVADHIPPNMPVAGSSQTHPPLPTSPSPATTQLLRSPFTAELFKSVVRTHAGQYRGHWPHLAIKHLKCGGSEMIY